MNETDTKLFSRNAAKNRTTRQFGLRASFAQALLGLVLLGMLVGCGADLGVLHPDTILFNGKMVTVDEDFSIAEAVAIKDGKFVAVGSNSEVRGLAGSRTEMVDLEGRTVLPGFNDPHEHFAHMLGFVTDDLTKKFRGSNSIREILAAVQGKIEQTPPGEMVWFFLGPGAGGDGLLRKDAVGLEEGRFPNRKDLDPISPDHPVFLEFGGKGAYASANSLALKKAGITRRTPEPSAQGLMGEIIKDASGEPTGLFQGRAAASLAHSVLVRHSVDTLVKTIQHASEMAVPYGITTIGDPNTNMSDVRDNQTWAQAYQRLSARGELMVRVNCILRLPILYRPTGPILEWFDNLLYDSGFGNETLRFGQIKISIYDSDDDFKLPREEVKRVIKAVHRAGWQLYIHVGQGESYDLAIEGLEEAYSEFPREDVRHVITHARFPTDKTLEVLKRYGVMVEPQTGSIYEMSDDYEEQNADPDRPAYGPTPLRTYLDHLSMAGIADIGKTVYAVVLGVAPSSTGILMLGLSDTRFAGMDLPIDLDPFGMKGCTLYVRPDTQIPVVTGIGVVSFPIVIPNDTALIELEAFLQFIGADPGAGNTLGAVVSNAARVKLGG